MRCATLTLQLVQITGQAKTKRRKKEAQLSVVVAAEKADLKIEPADPQRKLLSVQLKQFLADTIDRGSLEAAEVYELACDEFLQVIGRQYMEDIVIDDIIRFQKALVGRGMSPRTISNRHSSVKAFLRYCGYTPRNCRSHRSLTRLCPRSTRTGN